MLSDKLKTLILMGLKTTGDYDGGFSYIEEELTLEESEIVEGFFQYLKAHDLKIGHGNIDQRYKEYSMKFASTVKQDAEKATPKLFIHSACCQAHWELVVFEDGSADLHCEKCGKSAGPQVLVAVGGGKDMKCEHCGD